MGLLHTLAILSCLARLAVPFAAAHDHATFLPIVTELALTGLSPAALRRDGMSFCAPLATAAAHEASGGGRFRSSDPWSTACTGLEENSRCKVHVAPGSEVALGACTRRFFAGTHHRLLCVPAEAIVGAQTACQETDARAGDDCAYELEGERVEGVCGWDGVVATLGCVTPTAAAFLQRVEDVLSRPTPHHAVTVTVGPSGGSGGARVAMAATARLLPTRMLCTGAAPDGTLAAGGKLPLRLDLGPEPDATDSNSMPLAAGLPLGRVLELDSLHAVDKSLLRGALGAYVAHALNVTHAAPPTFVRLLLDGEYVGLYEVRAAAEAAVLTAALRRADGLELDADSAPLNALGVVEAEHAYAPLSAKEVALEAGARLGQMQTPTAHGWTRVNTGKRHGWVPSWTLKNVSCAALPGTLFRPLSALHSFQPSAWWPWRGTLPEPWWAPGLALMRALGPPSTLAGVRIGSIAAEVLPEAVAAADPAALQEALDIPSFLRALAASTALRAGGGHYGQGTHSFSLFADPCTAQLHFVPDPMAALQLPTNSHTASDFEHADTPAHYRLVHAVLHKPAWREEYMWLGSEAQRVLSELRNAGALQRVSAGKRSFLGGWGGCDCGMNTNSRIAVACRNLEPLRRGGFFS